SASWRWPRRKRPIRRSRSSTARTWTAVSSGWRRPRPAALVAAVGGTRGASADPRAEGAGSSVTLLKVAAPYAKTPFAYGATALSAVRRELPIIHLASPERAASRRGAPRIVEHPGAWSGRRAPRSPGAAEPARGWRRRSGRSPASAGARDRRGAHAAPLLPRYRGGAGPAESGLARSEEHTSELQSRFDLVCRLLL